MKISKKCCFVSGGFLLAFFVLVLLLKFVDVKQADNSDVVIGLSSLNNFFYCRYNDFFFNVTQWIGYYAILICVFFAGVGLVQWIQRKSLLKVDLKIYFLAGFYIITILTYVLFLFVTINTRPNILPDEYLPEPSFPSSHTMLSICVFVSSMIMAHDYFDESKFARAYVYSFCGLLIFVSIVGRILSGAHWFTDVIGSILLSGCYIFLFLAFLIPERDREKKKISSQS